MTQEEALGVVDYMIGLWPQMGDLRGNVDLSRVWVSLLRRYDVEAAKQALWRHRENQTEPIRPEPGLFKRLVREGREDNPDGVYEVPDIFIQAVDYLPDYEGPKSRRLGRWERLRFIRRSKAPDSRQGLIECAHAWARRLSASDGLRWVVLDGLTESQVRQRAHKLLMTGRCDT